MERIEFEINDNKDVITWNGAEYRKVEEPKADERPLFERLYRGCVVHGERNDMTVLRVGCSVIAGAISGGRLRLVARATINREYTLVCAPPLHTVVCLSDEVRDKRDGATMPVLCVGGDYITLAGYGTDIPFNIPTGEFDANFELVEGE